jgi:hypothetical protein
VEGPPRGESRPEHVLRYLTRYLSGGPIHDGRIIADEDGWIKFWARSRDKRKPGRLLEKKLVEKELWGPEFVRRWAMHILPKGFVRSRRYGGYHTTQSQAYLARCRELLPPSDDETEDVRELLNQFRPYSGETASTNVRIAKLPWSARPTYVVRVGSKSSSATSTETHRSTFPFTTSTYADHHRGPLADVASLLPPCFDNPCSKAFTCLARTGSRLTAKSPSYHRHSHHD